ncbi:MAG TPA: MSMEG_0567/Sll0786 family nitrogen starvation N-acetyltransferase [Polyangiaceae bacterium]|jgi:putative N-acetyltransferase (TIGR04045 family)|nr:MSMEG_0567/Sll0786 family nitrogen starvation N-acetyltransferase [Polyangiaceae bacterium]
MMLMDVPPFISAAITAHIATDLWQLNAYYAVRRAIFAEEQGLFDRTDIDEHDAVATPIVATSHIAGMLDEVVGAVRIYESEREPRTWFGGRLGVVPAYRSRRVVGTSLICAAVSTARAWGAERFLATIQLQNVRYFEQHHFATIEPITVCGAPHCLMQADLTMYPPNAALAGTPVYGDAATRIVRGAGARAA